MARRKLAGKDQKIIQGHRRDAFFKAMRQKGGVPRMPTDAPEVAADNAEVADTPIAAVTDSGGAEQAEGLESTSAEGDQRNAEG